MLLLEDSALGCAFGTSDASSLENLFEREEFNDIKNS